MKLPGFRAQKWFGKFGAATACGALAIALLTPAFAYLQPAQSNDATDAFDASSTLRFPAPVAMETLAFDMNRVVGAQMRMIRYQATAHQRKVAETRVRTYLAAKRGAPSQPPPAKSTGTTKTPKKGKAEESKAAAKPKKQPRYLAVDTVKDQRSSPKAEKVMMIWDTHSEAFVGNNIYDVEKPPAVGSATKLETYAATYIGTGS